MQSFETLRAQLLASQPPDRQERLADSFAKLMGDVQPTLEARNRDRFTQNLTIFRQEVRAFIV